MKAIFSLIVLILSMLMTTGFFQDKNRRELKEWKKLEKQIQIQSIVDAREFVFVARTALPTGMRSVNLQTNQNYIKFQPDLINSYMPFFGNAYSSVVYGTDTGLHFAGKPEIFTVEKKEKSYQVTIVVRGENDNFKLFLSVGSEGSASLSISSNYRSTISYQGEIIAPVKTEDIIPLP